MKPTILFEPSEAALVVLQDEQEEIFISTIPPPEPKPPKPPKPPKVRKEPKKRPPAWNKKSKLDRVLKTCIAIQPNAQVNFHMIPYSYRSKVISMLIERMDVVKEMHNLREKMRHEEHAPARDNVFLENDGQNKITEEGIDEFTRQESGSVFDLPA